MQHECEQVIQKELGSHERLIWVGRPKQGIMLRPNDIFLIPFSILWGGFAIFWEVMALTSVLKGAEKGGPTVLIFPIFGIPFVIVGLYLIFGRFIVDAKQRGNTYYGVTNERIIIVSGLFSKKVKSLNIKTLSDIALTEKANRYGTISFGPTNPFNWWYAGCFWPGIGNIPPMFEMIPNVKEVYDEIRKIQDDK